jgi:ribosome-associated heat shock protein Hsp15
VDSTRIDRWLCAARIFKSRSLAREACVAGRVQLNDVPAKPSSPVRVGDEVRADKPSGLRLLEVKRLAERRLTAPLALELYEDPPPPPPPREERIGVRARGTGRPTKRERRLLEELRRGRSDAGRS